MASGLGAHSVSLRRVPPYSVTISIPTGDPSELRVVDVSNWVGKGLVFPRSPTVAAKQEILGQGQVGVYLLIGEAVAADVDTHIYIGESENVFGRLRDHQAKPELDYWTQTVAFTTSNKTLNKGHIRYMESVLLTRARESASWTVVNSNSPSPPPLGLADKISADAFLETLFGVAPILGVSAFVQAVARGGGRLTLSGPEAKAEGEDQPGGFLVFAGSLARKSETPTLQQVTRDLRRRLLKEGRLVAEGQSLRLTHDHLFSSPSIAAACFLARSANGRTAWRDSEGRTLRDIQESGSE